MKSNGASHEWLLLALLALMCTAQTAAGQPQLQGEKSLLEQGRELAQAKKWEAACTAFEQALRAAPNDPALLSELGYAYLMRNQLDRAEKYTHQAVDAATTNSLKAASLYNLGRIKEAQGQPELAIELYKASLRLRPNDEVAHHILELDEFAEAAPCRAPAKNLDDLCVCLKRVLKSDRCYPGTSDKSTEEATNLDVVWYPERPSVGEHSLFLAVRFRDGWSVVRHFSRQISRTHTQHRNDLLAAGRVTIGGRQLLRLVSQSNVSEDHCQLIDGVHFRMSPNERDREFITCQTELTSWEICTLDEAHHELNCPVHVNVACKSNRDLLADSNDFLPRLTEKGKQWLNKALRDGKTALKGQLRLSAEGTAIRVTGTQIKVSEVSIGPSVCDKPQPVDLTIP